MSTKWIKEVLLCVEREFGAPGSAHIAAAKAEVEAIERNVAEALRLMKTEYPEDCVHRVVELLESIAKDAP